MDDTRRDFVAQNGENSYEIICAYSRIFLLAQENISQKASSRKDARCIRFIFVISDIWDPERIDC